MEKRGLCLSKKILWITDGGVVFHPAFSCRSWHAGIMLQAQLLRKVYRNIPILILEGDIVDISSYNEADTQTGSTTRSWRRWRQPSAAPNGEAGLAETKTARLIEGKKALEPLSEENSVTDRNNMRILPTLRLYLLSLSLSHVLHSTSPYSLRP